MIGRALFWVLEVGWLMAWALHFGAGWDVALMPVAALAGGLVRRRMSWAVPTWAGALVAGALTGGAWGVFLATVAVWRGATPPNRDHPAVYERMAIAAVATVPLAVADPAWAWTVAAVLAVGLLAALELNRHPDAIRTAHLRLAGSLALVGAAAGLAVAGAVALVPITLAYPLLHAMLAAFGRVAAFLVKAFSTAKARSLDRKTFLPKGHTVHARTVHPVATPLWLYLGLGVMVVLFIVLVHFGVRGTASGVRPSEHGGGGQEDVERERVDPARTARAAPRGVLTRRVFRTGMRRAARRRSGPGPGETVREWMARVYGVPSLALASLYEEVRYGGTVDDSTRARTVQRGWPKDAGPPQEPPTQTGR